MARNVSHRVGGVGSTTGDTSVSPTLPTDDIQKARSAGAQIASKPVPPMPMVLAQGGPDATQPNAALEERAKADDGSRTQGQRDVILTAEGRKDAPSPQGIPGTMPGEKGYVAESDPGTGVVAPAPTLYKAGQRQLTSQETGAPEPPPGVREPFVNRPHGSEPMGVDVRTGTPILPPSPQLENVHGDDDGPDVDAGYTATMRTQLNAPGTDPMADKGPDGQPVS